METAIDVQPEIKSNENDLELYSDEYPFRLPLRITKFDDELQYKKFIKSCEKLIRNSNEYRLWRNYIMDVLGHTSCMITDESNEACSVSVHHHVPSLYQVVKAVINKKLDTNEEFSSFDICLDTIALHFQNKIGYVCLIESMHEKFHAGFLQIPKQLIKGNYQQFLSEYSRYLDDTDMESILSRLAITEGNTNWSKDNYPGLS